MFVGYVGVEDREKKKKVAEEDCTRVMTGFRWREGCVGWADNFGQGMLYMGYDWLSMEGRLYRLRRKYGQSKLYVGYDWLSMEGRLLRMGSAD